jgi:nucleotide-binding universal stress UspA family protein
MNAIILCSEINAHLSVLVVGLTPIPMGGYGVGLSDTWILEREAVVAAIKMRQTRVKSLANAYGVLADIDICYADKEWVGEMIGQHARYSDITLIGPDLLHQPELKAIAINGAIFHSGRPVLIVPAGIRPTLRPATVLLAWDSQIEAVRAARESRDLLAEACEVHVTTIDTKASTASNDIEPLTNIAAYLTRHGAKVAIDRLPACAKPVADVLRQHAANISADMIVLGQTAIRVCANGCLSQHDPARRIGSRTTLWIASAILRRSFNMHSFSRILRNSSGLQGLASDNRCLLL